MFMEKIGNLDVSPDVSLDDVVSNLSHEGRHAFLRLIIERDRLSVGWPEMLERYQKAVDTISLFSLSGDVAVDINRIRTLAALEKRYGSINSYFSG